MQPFTLFRTRRIYTLNPANPIAIHVAVRDGRILGAGPLEDLAGWGPHKIDDQFADKVLIPGLIEGHSPSRLVRSGASFIAAFSMSGAPMELWFQVGAGLRRSSAPCPSGLQRPQKTKRSAAGALTPSTSVPHG